MNITFGGGFIGLEGLTYLGRNIIKQLGENHNVNLDAPEISGYWEQYYNNFKPENEDIYILNGHIPRIPQILSRLKGRKIIPIVIFETDLPQDWIKPLKSPQIQEIWTISKFGKRLIEKANIGKEIYVIDTGIDERFKIQGNNMFPKDKSFKFLHISAPHCKSKIDRKGLDLLLPAFKQVFGDSDKVKLILKINTIYANQFFNNFNIHDYLLSLLPSNTNISNISVTTTNLKTYQMNNLYRSIDCGVFPSRGECLGYPQLELISKNVPVITTNYGATNEYSVESLRVSLEGETVIGNGFPYYNSKFAQPSLADLKNKLKNVYENKQLYIDETNDIQPKIIRKYSWTNCNKQINERLKKYN